MSYLYQLTKTIMLRKHKNKLSMSDFTFIVSHAVAQKNLLESETGLKVLQAGVGEVRMCRNVNTMSSLVCPLISPVPLSSVSSVLEEGISHKTPDTHPRLICFVAMTTISYVSNCQPRSRLQSARPIGIPNASPLRTQHSRETPRCPCQG